MDIIVTTPRSQMKNAAQEAADCIANGGGYYFRRFAQKPSLLKVGDRVWYSEDGWLRGFAKVDRIEYKQETQQCDTTGYLWERGWYVFMRADSWQWVEPQPYKGFQGYRYFDHNSFCYDMTLRGGWTDPKPRTLQRV